MTKYQINYYDRKHPDDDRIQHHDTMQMAIAVANLLLASDKFQIVSINTIHDHGDHE